MELSTEETQNIVKLYDDSTGLFRFVRTDRDQARSLELVEKAFLRLGLSRNEIKVYVFVARTGEHKASEISEALSLHRTETYRILRDLEKKGLVSSVFEKPLKFIATPFEKALDTLIETKKMKLSLLEKKKDSLIDLWLALPKPEVEQERKEVFQILEGEEQVNLKADELTDNATDEMLLFVSESDITNFYHSSLFDKLERMSKKNVNVQLMTNYSPKSRFFVDKLKLKNVKCSPSDMSELSTFVIADDSQLLLLIRKNNGKKRVVALWTNYEAFVKALRTLFLELWNRDA
jgi:sugar-specific transcriptional regulator TrmB